MTNKTEKKLSNAAWLRAICHLSFVILLAGLLMPATGFAQAGNRWLLIYNTSGSMHDRVEGVEAVTQDLLSTAMHGNLRAGDTIGIWTYNDQLHADEAPLLTWSPERARDITQKALQFLSRHPYDKTAAFGDVLANMLRVVKLSDNITIVLVSDANDPIKGTPFDARLDAFYKANFQQQRKARMPVVTVFHGEHGVLTTNTVALAPWPANIPPVPPPVVAKVAPPKPAPAPAPQVPSLVIVGKKAETTFKPASQLPDPTDVPAAVAEQEKATAAASVAAQPQPETPKTEVPQPAPKVDETPKVVAPAVAPAEPTPPPTTAQTPKAEEPAPTPAPAAVAAPENVPAEKSAAPATPPVETATAESAPNLFTVRNIAIASVGFTVLVCALLILAARNARKATRASLISQSLDRERQ